MRRQGREDERDSAVPVAHIHDCFCRVWRRKESFHDVFFNAFVCSPLLCCAAEQEKLREAQDELSALMGSINNVQRKKYDLRKVRADRMRCLPIFLLLISFQPFG